jgi:hypothetical protein
MMNFHPYSTDELRHLRRLIVASGASVEEWSARLRRAADFLQSLSPAQAEVVAQQAQAIADDPDDYGDEGDLIAVRQEIALVPEGERLKYVSREVIATRRRHFPGLLGDQ